MIADCILIVDDHPVYRDSLTEKLKTEFSKNNIKVTGVDCFLAALEVLSQSHDRWLVVLDIQMPGMSGLPGIKAFKQLNNVAALVSISGLDENLWAPRTLSAGASCFISKNNTSLFISRKLSQLLFGEGHVDEIPENSSSVKVPSDPVLTHRQGEVLKLVAQGHPNKVIAGMLHITEQTVKIHINQIFKELGVFNRTQAALAAQKSNLT